MNAAVNYFQFLKLILSVLYSPVQAETFCPEPEHIAPCVCSDAITTILNCQGLISVPTLNNVLENSARHTYQEVHIENSTLVYLPSDLLGNVTIKELYLKNSMFTSIFDSPPDGLLSLSKLEIDNTGFQRSLSWELFAALKNLEELTVQNVEVTKLSSRFKENIPQSLKRLSFYNTKLKYLRTGALANLPNLDSFTAEACEVSTLTRDIFPTPFYARFLYFDNNKISSIPDDLFTDMPRLEILSLENNLISVLPESAFGNRSQNLPILKLEGNPLSCDCQLEWIIRNKPEILEGTCALPEELSGRKLKDLVLTDFKC